MSWCIPWGGTASRMFDSILHFTIFVCVYGLNIQVLAHSAFHKPTDRYIWSPNWAAMKSLVCFTLRALFQRQRRSTGATNDLCLAETDRSRDTAFCGGHSQSKYLEWISLIFCISSNNTCERSIVGLIYKMIGGQPLDTIAKSLVLARLHELDFIEFGVLQKQIKGTIHHRETYNKWLLYGFFDAYVVVNQVEARRRETHERVWASNFSASNFTRVPFLTISISLSSSLFLSHPSYTFPFDFLYIGIDFCYRLYSSNIRTQI